LSTHCFDLDRQTSAALFDFEGGNGGTIFNAGMVAVGADNSLGATTRTTLGCEATNQLRASF
jgi:hypothetical protein